jgi:cell division protein FtsI (penicillin-binding protein 3)
LATVRFRPKLRLVLVMIGLGAGMASIAGRLVWVQGLASSRYAQLAAEQRLRHLELPPQRGSIYDRNGNELAMSMDVKTVFANPRFVTDPAAAAAALAPVLDQKPSTLGKKLKHDSGFVYLARKVHPDVAEKVDKLDITGVDTVNESKRFYPGGTLASHIVGFVGIDNQGLGGLEHHFDELLRGKPGEVLMERDPQGRPIPSGESRFVAPTAGADVVLTIDREMQFAAQTTLRRTVERWGAKGGTAIVMRPGNGEILALANYPTFDPNSPTKSPEGARRNRAVTDVYEPGSTSKVITAAAALETNVVRPADVINVPDRIGLNGEVYHDHNTHPPVDLTFTQVIQQSSNVGTIKVAMNLGPERLHDYMSRFGYGSVTGLEFPGEAAGLLPRVEEWWDSSLPTLAIGQGVAVTPMQIVGVFATLANQGVSVDPKLVMSTIDSSGNEEPVAEKETKRVIKAATAETLTKLLVGVTEIGTGRNALIPGYQVAGKTGSAEKVVEGQPGYSGYVSSFIGFAPAGDPRLVVGVVLDDPRPIWGGVTAAPAFREIMQFGLRHLGIGPGPVLQPEGAPLPAPVQSGGVPPPSTDGVASGTATD